MSGYKTAWFCVSCDGELTDWQVMYSNGRCPKCGFKGESAGTIVDTNERAYRVDLPWWAPFNRKAFRVYLDEER
jgi:hypothetical protein